MTMRGWLTLSPDADGPEMKEELGLSQLEMSRSPIAGFLVLAITSLIAACFLWISLAEIEEVVQARGQIEPFSQVKIINHHTGGKIAEILVRDGQRVEEGDRLVTFVPDIARHAHGEVEAQYEAAQASHIRLEAENQGVAPVYDALFAEKRPDLVERQMQLYSARLESQQHQLKNLRLSVKERETEVIEARAEIDRVQNSLALMNEQLAAVRELSERGLYPKLKLKELERQGLDLEADLTKAKAALAATRAALEQSKSELEEQQSAQKSEILAELTAASERKERLENRLNGQSTVLSELTIVAPVSGIVEDLRVTANGQSVGANEPILKLVPIEEGLVVRAGVANKDIGMIEPGMQASIKVLAYDFTRFGTIPGTVETVAADATWDQRQDDNAYVMTIAAKESGQFSGRDKLLPGMIVDVELFVGTRTVLSYLTSGITSYREQFFKS